MSSEKASFGLPTPSAAAPPAARPTPSSKVTRFGKSVMAASAVYGLYLLGSHACSHHAGAGNTAAHPSPAAGGLSVQEYDAMLLKGSCPTQVDPLDVGVDWDVHGDEAYAKLATGRLARAIQINTVSEDSMASGPLDERFAGVAEFGKFLDDEFPLVNEKLELELLNEYGRLYTWAGSNSSLKPVVLMAHQDTVPVPDFTVPRWTYDPFGGHVDKDGWIWGRGSADCKNTLMGILGAVEKLAQDGFEPERTILLAFGFDEEIGGLRGAVALSDRIEELYGKDSVALIVDEGFTGVDEAYGTTIASLGVAEKGSLNIEIEVDTLGGHSSVPPAHTSIGILSLLIAELERKPFPAKLNPESPYLQYLQCAADFGPDMDKDLKQRLKDPREWDALADELGQDRIVRAFLGTTQAVDLISGGVKVNAIPEQARATVNFRIDFTSSVAETFDRVVGILRPVVEGLNLTMAVPGQTTDASVDVVRLSNGHGGNFGLEPAPLTPTKGRAFELIAGTTRHVFPDSIVAPSAMIANTDTKSFWNLSRAIYRFLPAPLALVKNFHTVDERISIDGHLTVTAWYHKLLLNTAGWDAE